jgi:hypothetical protein
MASLPFLGSFTGSSIDKLLTLEHRFRIDSLVLALEQRLLDRMEEEGLDAMTRVERDILAVCALEREVNDGGFAQFFLNEEEWAGEAVGALNRIGCETSAGLTQEAIDATVTAGDDLYDALEPLDQRFYESPDDITARLFAYIKTNRSDVGLTPRP